MKTILTLLLLIVVTTSCQLKKSDNTETAVTESTEIDNAEDCTADTVKATAIFWIDKAETKTLQRVRLSYHQSPCSYS